MPWPPLTRPRHFVNPVTLFALAGMAFVYGMSYLVGDIVNYDGESLQLVRIHDDLLPSSVYGGLWIVVSVLCFGGMYSRKLFRVGFSSFIACAIGWSLLYMILWLDEPSSYGLLVSSVWWATVAIASYTLVVTELAEVKKAARAQHRPEDEVR